MKVLRCLDLQSHRRTLLLFSNAKDLLTQIRQGFGVVQHLTLDDVTSATSHCHQTFECLNGSTAAADFTLHKSAYAIRTHASLQHCRKPCMTIKSLLKSIVAYSCGIHQLTVLHIQYTQDMQLRRLLSISLQQGLQGLCCRLSWIHGSNQASWQGPLYII